MLLRCSCDYPPAPPYRRLLPASCSAWTPFRKAGWPCSIWRPPAALCPQSCHWRWGSTGGAAVGRVPVGVGRGQGQCGVAGHGQEGGQAQQLPDCRFL